jgi:hypothetical protein
MGNNINHEDWNDQISEKMTSGEKLVAAAVAILIVLLAAAIALVL